MANVTVTKDRYTVDSLYQWSKDQDLIITGLSLASIPEIHFTNDAMDKAIVKQATMNDAGVITARIPNSLLQKPYKIRAYVCIYEGDSFRSLYLITIPIEARSMPNDYTLTVGDDEVYSFNALENLVNNTLVTLTADNKKVIEDVTKKCDETVNSVKESNQTLETNLTKKCNDTVSAVNKSNEELQAELNQKYANAMESCEQNFETQEQNFANDVQELTRTVNARVDNIIAHNNDTEGNSELLDMRVDADGVIYNSAGEAIRKQFDSIGKSVYAFEERTNDDNQYDLAHAKTAMFFDTPTYIGTFTPKFQKTEDTFYYAIISLDTPVGEGVFPTITILKEATINCGESIIVNRELSGKVGLVFYTTDTTNRVMTSLYDTANVKARYLRQIIANSGDGMKPTFTGFEWGMSFGGTFTIRTTHTEQRDKKIELINEEINLIKEDMTELENKKVISTFAIIGDSWSTYAGWLPEGNATWYTNDGTQDSNDVESVKDTWWWQLSKELKISLLCNESYSGSCVCNSPLAPRDESTSFVNRAKVNLGEGNTIGAKPDLIFVFGGINDANAIVVGKETFDLGEPKYSDWTAEDLKLFAPAYCYLIDYLMTYNPHAQIVCVGAFYCYGDILNIISTVCEHYGLLYIPIRHLVTEEKGSSHPNKAGMTVIKDTIIDALEQSELL